MEISELKKMLRHSTAVLIMDNGDPSFVVVSYDTYKSLLGDDEGPALVRPAFQPPVSNGASTGELELLERINKDILALKAQIEDEEKSLGIDDSR
ncbi:MAG TPA: hypothetical protein VG866_02355 [Candidatus Paceibacterota bacterium]|jgi:hypothetical protein|nr:hypothetical protein [Candidatus Paceibacterota bacterium]